MTKRSRNEVAVGVFVVVGFIVMTLIVFFVSGVYLFRPGYSLHVLYDYVSILDRGAPVRMAGVRIGEVSGVELLDDPGAGKKRVKVKVFIEKGIQIRENYLFTIRGTHILSEPHIEISPEPGEAPLLREGQTVQGVNPVPVEALVDRAHSIAENLDMVMRRLRDTVQDEENAKAFKNILIHLANVTESLEMILQGSEKDFKQAAHSLEASSASLQVILDRIQKGEGTMGRLFTDDELYRELRDFVAEIKAHPWKLFKRK